MISRIQSNIKRGCDVEIGSKTLIVGPCGSGKTTLVQAVEYALTGSVSDVGFRQTTADPSLLKTLAEKPWARLETDQGPIERSGRTVTGPVDHYALPLRDLKEAVIGTPEKAQRFILSAGGSRITEEAILSKIPEHLHDRYRVVADGPTPVDALMTAREHANTRLRSARLEATGARKLLDSASAPTTARPTAADIEALRQRDQEIQARLNTVFGYLSSRNQMNRAAILAEELKKIEAQHTQLGQAFAQLHQIEDDVDVSKLESKRPFVEVFRLLSHDPTCGICGQDVQPGVIAQRGEQFATWLNGQFELARDAVARQTKKTEIAAKMQELAGSYSRIVAECRTAMSRQVEEIPNAEEEYQALQGERDRVRATLQQFQTSEAAWRQIDATRASAQDMERLAEEWQALSKAIDAAIEEIVEAWVGEIRVGVQKALPPTDEFDLQLSPFRFGLKRNGVLHSALSGAEGVRVLCALGSVLSATSSVLIPEERGFEPDTLTATMEALSELPHQVILVATVEPRKVPAGWTIIRTSEVTTGTAAPAPKTRKKAKTGKADEERLRELGWSASQILRMQPSVQQKILSENLVSDSYSVLPDGSLYLVASA